jgi:hypothetical protein
MQNIVNYIQLSYKQQRKSDGLNKLKIMAKKLINKIDLNGKLATR